MSAGLLEAQGIVVEPGALAIARARDFACRLQAQTIAFADLVECRQDGQAETVVFDVDVEVGQLTVNDIRPRERVAVVFDPHDRRVPEVLSLRADFPRVPHLNIRELEIPRSLCLFEESFTEIRRRWTASWYVGRLRDWLQRTARGQLHADDQALEPFLLNTAGRLIVPHDLISKARSAAGSASGLVGELQALSISSLSKTPPILVASHSEPAEQLKDPPAFVAATFLCGPRDHGVIHRTPRTIADLHELLGADDLIGAIRRRLSEWKTTPAIGAHLVLIVLIPLRRSPQGPHEIISTWAFLCGPKVRDLGVALGLWDIHNGGIGTLLSVDQSRRGQDAPLDTFNVVEGLSRRRAALYNGYADPIDTNIVAVGCGALGSQVAMNAHRSAFGFWTLVDKDVLLPHNLARHALTSMAGLAKSRVLAVWMGEAVEDTPQPAALVCDVLDPGNELEALDAAFGAAGLILDMSASVEVARHLALKVQTPARRASLFLNPSGTDSVLLLEDSTRRLTLDQLEMQYYREVLLRSELADHIVTRGDRLRFGQSCRDVTFQLPQDLVALHAATTSRELRRALVVDGASIRIWRTSPDGSVQAFQAPIAAARSMTVGSWTVVTDDAFLAQLAALRKNKLPNETGGVLMGDLDVERKRLYLVHALPSPPDSEEWPTHYIRGSKYLRAEVEECQRRVGYQLQYVGEWHSHPDGATLTPSNDDGKVFAWLTQELGRAGVPPVLLIAGRGDEVAVFLDCLAPRKAPRHVFRVAKTGTRRSAA